MEFGLYQKQSMNLVMTTELRQAITLLQYSTLDLSAFIHEQALENPLMEIKDGRDLDEWKKQVDFSVSEDAKPYEGDPNFSPFDHISKDESGLREHLLEQIRLLDSSDEEREVVTYLALHVDEAGYFQHSLADIAIELGRSEDEVEEGLLLLQQLDPIGVGARSLRECLLLQLQELPARDSLAEIVVGEYLELLAEKKWKQIAKELSITMQEVQSVYDLIQTLEPRPGINFYSEPTRFIVPDVSVEKVDGELVVTVHDDLLPPIKLNRQYQYLLQENAETEASKYAKQKYQQMMWLLKSINQRQQTLFKVTEAIVEHQKEFFEDGTEALKPLTLKEIAEKVDVHESTVSRTTTQKYVQTPKGLFELKYFFTSGVQANNTTTSSSQSIKQMIKAMIDNENKQKPLSDQKIVNQLKEEKDVSISRRAVAKYRDEMNIPSSSKRKRYE
ncbi:RNA polymerase factor sigma-54 [Desertibacillus haloalkaliphilus]|nr:RNA polymerase factor sigma-54 [Desertibacillus haloalkaliphilus]